MRWKRLLIIVLFPVVVVVGFAVYKTVQEPAHLYKHSGDFAGCPQRPSCVSSLSDDEEHYIEPAEAVPMELLRTVIEEAGGRVVSESPNYLHAVFETPRMRYRDDAEFLIMDGELLWRSISRFGYRDFGVNRARLEDLRWELDRRS